MDRQPSRVDFAAIGHQDNWDQVVQFINAVRDPTLSTLGIEQIQEIFAWIPPRVIFRVIARSIQANTVAQGVYIETFIPPEQLASPQLSGMLRKVKQAAACAERIGARVASLGGFTSIVLEGNTNLLASEGITAFTTGNTLTSVLIAKGVEKACAIHGLDLQHCQLLIIGSTGDIGSACTRYFTGKVQTLLLNARKVKGLTEQGQAIVNEGQACEYSTDLSQLLPRADVVISVASTAAPLFNMDQCMPHTLICDAGYPKNILAEHQLQWERIWHGGMGQVQGGFHFEPKEASSFYQFPLPNIGHGCVLESMLLAWENLYESFSSGRGLITPQRIELMWSIAQKHGIQVSPFFNHHGLWSSQKIASDAGAR